MEPKSKIECSEKTRANPKHRQNQGIFENADFFENPDFNENHEKRHRNGANVEHRVLRKNAGEAKTQAKTRYF